jgi:subtilisin family serine protease
VTRKICLALIAVAALICAALVPTLSPARGGGGGGHSGGGHSGGPVGGFGQSHMGMGRSTGNSFRPSTASRHIERGGRNHARRAQRSGSRYASRTHGRRWTSKSENTSTKTGTKTGTKISTGYPTRGNGRPTRGEGYPPRGEGNKPRPPHGPIPTIGGVPIEPVTIDPVTLGNPSAGSPGSAGVSSPASAGGGNAGTGSPAIAGPGGRNGFFPPPAGEGRYVPNEVLLDIAAGVSTQQLDVIARRFGLTRLDVHNLRLVGRAIHRWRIDNGRSVTAVIRSLAGETRIAGAQPNYLYRLEGQNDEKAPTQADNSAQYVVAKLHLTDAHRLATGRNVLVAVIDSGIDTAHPDLAGAVAASFDVLGPHEAHFHGTAMAGAIAARGQLIGVAPRVRLLAVRALNAQGEGTTASIADGIDWAVGRGARVLNLSFAGPHDPLLQQHLAAAHGRRVVLIAAAGNAGPTSAPLYPAADAHVIAVTATDADDRLFAQANRGRHIAVAAPGVDILEPAPNGSVQLISGTSIAAAHVSGVAALIIELAPSLGPDEVRTILMRSAVVLSLQEAKDHTGAGLADAFRAIQSTNDATPVQPPSAGPAVPVAAQ